MVRARHLRLAAVGLAGLLTLPSRAGAQGLALTDVEFDGGAWFSIVNRDAWLAGGQLLTSNRLASGGDGRVIFFTAGALRLGAEVGYHYYWSYQAVFGTNAVIHAVDADHVSVVVRYAITPRLSAEAGGGLQFFDGFNDLSAQAAVRYAIPVNPRLSILLGTRADFVFDANALLLPVMLTGGFSIKP